ncbi:glycosyltransferase family 2 protein [Aurantimonas sp. VKM B-3413]|uniref:glycosyltransferase family 2 protein n=1 Tax=Aurantimonas sp. VKM B-3413 TaxID=2779401 RepID=UPI001E563E3E|nr:glycosyltransferase family 2 protein [Aurantimonas sp. VKM B-3413]MCB8836129.1 glycosyltransferase family 2 protein [Aurantimonas sp. VKM B-3413]
MEKYLAICAIVRNEALYLAEWIDFHRRMGVQRFQIYDNESMDRPDQIVERLGANVSCEILRWPTARTWRETQRSAYMDGVERLHTYKYVAFIDVDEFLHSERGETLPVRLSKFGRDVAAIGVCQRVFGSSGLLAFDGRNVTERFTLRAEQSHSDNRWFKSIVRPTEILDFDSSHSVVLKTGQYVLADGRPLRRSMAHPGISDRVCHGPLRVNHYLLKSLEEFRWKQARWRGTTLESRYGDEFFFRRDAYSSAVTDPSLVGVVERDRRN